MKYLTEEESRRGTGLPFEEQQRLRNGDFTFLTEFGTYLQLDETVMCTANYIVNLFFLRRSYLQYDRFIVSAGAIMLACKILNFKRQDSRIIPSKIANKFHALVQNKILQNQTAQPYDEQVEKEYMRKIFKAEFKLIKTLEFDFDIELPLFYTEFIVDKLYSGCEDKLTVLTMAHVMANECMRSIAPLCLHPLVVGIGCVVLAGVICNMPRPHELLLENPEKWWTYISPSISLADITRAVSLILEAISIK